MAVSYERLEENCVYYSLFPLLEKKTGLEKILLGLREKYFLCVGVYLPQYVWQKDSFNLQIEKTGNCLAGQTRYGMNVDDEWFIVFLLYELSYCFPDLVIRVYEKDGEFLLIEAAHYLPEWLKPANSDNRVFIHNGSLHIIPEQHELSLVEATNFVRSYPKQTKAQTEIEQAILRKIREYPCKISKDLHRTHCYLPAAIAVILNQQPLLLSAAVDAFCERDADDLKLCRAMKFFPPETCVMTEVLFTKFLYAQLIHCRYQPDHLVGWNIPLPNHPEFKVKDLGMKLACGFEILCCKGSIAEEKKNKFVDDNNWKRFLKKLEDRHYFQGELKGSLKYRKLLDAAEMYYSDFLVDQSNTSPSTRIRTLVSQIEYNIDDLRKAEATLIPPDDDGWLVITEDDLNQMLLEMSACPNYPKKPPNVTSAMKSFVNEVSSIEGVEFPKNKKDKPVDFDPDQFADSVQHILDFKIPESDHDSSSDMSGYSSDSDKDVNYHIHKSDNTQKNRCSMKTYLKKMDAELHNTEVGKSFDSIQEQSDTNVNSKEMPKTFGKPLKSPNLEAPLPKMRAPHSQNEDIDEEDFDYKPVDVDLTVLKNILESYTSQEGSAGPAGNILQAMGVSKPL